MAYKNIIYSPEFPYHVYCRTNNRDPYPIPLEEAWEAYCFCLRKIVQDYKFQVYGFVMMNNHYHLLGQCHEAYSLDKVMHSFQMNTTKIILQKSDKINRLYGGPYKACEIRSEYHYANIFKYIAQNPLRANIVSDYSNYPFSSYSHFFNNYKFTVMNTCEGYDSLVPINFDDRNMWLNTLIKNEDASQIRDALKKNKFKYKKINRQINPLNFRRI